MKEIDDMDDDERKSSSDWSLAGAYILLVLTVLLVPIAPFIFIQKFTDLLNFTATGQIGDTIGGTTAPIIGLTSAVLVFLAFRSQVKANELVIEELDKEKRRRRRDDSFRIISEHLIALANDYDRIAVKRNDGEIVSGSPAIAIILAIVAVNGTHTKLGLIDSYLHGLKSLVSLAAMTRLSFVQFNVVNASIDSAISRIGVEFTVFDKRESISDAMLDRRKEINQILELLKAWHDKYLEAYHRKNRLGT